MKPTATTFQTQKQELRNAIKECSSHLRLVVDLQEMANTIIYVQEHGYNTQTELKDAFSESQKQLDQATDQLMEMNADLKNINRQIHYSLHFHNGYRKQSLSFRQSLHLSSHFLSALPRSFQKHLSLYPTWESYAFRLLFSASKYDFPMPGLHA